MAQVQTLPVSEPTTPARLAPQGSRRLDVISHQAREIIRPQRKIPSFARDGSGYSGDIEQWHPPAITTEQARQVEEDIQRLEQTLQPPEKAPLLTRVLALLSHYRAEANPPQVERLMAEDWAEDLQDYPMEAIEHAARWWRRNKKFRPAICEIRELCEEFVREERVALERMRMTLNKHYNQQARKAPRPSLQVVAATCVRRMPEARGSD